MPAVMKKKGGKFVTCIVGWDYLFQTMQCGNVVWVWKYKETAEGFAHPFLEFIMYRLERSSGVTKNRLTSVEYDAIYSLEGSESALQKPLVSKRRPVCGLVCQAACQVASSNAYIFQKLEPRF